MTSLKILIIYNKEVPESAHSAQEAERALFSLGIESELFVGVWRNEAKEYADSLGLKLGVFERKYSRIDSVIGCFLSHMKCWERTEENIIILEHDARISQAHIGVLGHLAELATPSSPQAVNLGRPSYGTFSTPQSGPGIHKLFSKHGRYFPGTHAYFCNSAARKSFINKAYESGIFPVDLFLSLTNFPFLQELYPWPFVAEDTFSTVQGVAGATAKHGYSESYKFI